MIRAGALATLVMTIWLCPGRFGQAADPLPKQPQQDRPQQAESQQAQRRAAARAAATERRRTWLYETLQDKEPDPAKLAQWKERLEQMSDSEIDRTAALMLEELERPDVDWGQILLHAARRDQAQHEARRRAQVASQAQLVETMRARQPTYLPVAAAVAPGFHSTIAWVPGITWLPAGASLTAAATVLPGGHVRISAHPFFSSVGPVNSFPFYYGGYPSFGYPYWGYPPVFPYYGQYINIRRGHHHHHGHGHHRHGHVGHPPRGHFRQGGEVWYDGLRTRRDPRPRR